jgi:uncharacterized SAM-binding protein YcdF (DUF218 family)
VALEFTQAGKKRERAWRLARVAVLALAAWSLVAWGAAQALIVRAELPRADVLVVLSGSSAYVERTERAAQLFQEGRAPKIILTNDNQRGPWSEAEQRNPTFVERASAELRRGGVPADRIEVLPGALSGTYSEAVVLRRYAMAQGLHSILVVTSAYHSRRALWTLRHVFQGSGIEVGLDAVAPGKQMPGPATWWWYPLGWQMVASEYPKFIYYWLHYR